jgi:hypothetical protein
MSKNDEQKAFWRERNACPAIICESAGPPVVLSSSMFVFPVARGADVVITRTTGHATANRYSGAGETHSGGSVISGITG